QLVPRSRRAWPFRGIVGPALIAGSRNEVHRTDSSARDATTWFFILADNVGCGLDLDHRITCVDGYRIGSYRVPGRVVFHDLHTSATGADQHADRCEPVSGDG